MWRVESLAENALATPRQMVKKATMDYQQVRIPTFQTLKSKSLSWYEVDYVYAFSHSLRHFFVLHVEKGETKACCRHREKSKGGKGSLPMAIAEPLFKLTRTISPANASLCMNSKTKKNVFLSDLFVLLPAGFVSLGDSCRCC
jgi:hypothetical protein